MAKISQTHHITRRGVVKRNPRKINRTLQEQAQYDRASSNSVYDTKLRELMDMGWSYGAAHRVALAEDMSSSKNETEEYFLGADPKKHKDYKWFAGKK
jgi:hypothetical protein